jgi:3-deoxy-D-manno-octulosonate 8-phosphate phosphatase (KDO 8-P phosphatase)
VATEPNSSALDEATFARRARDLAWVVCDVDGVLTDGRLYYGASGEELKTFHIRDGLALKLARDGGLKVGLLSARRSEALTARARDLGLDRIVMGRQDKSLAFDEFLASESIRQEEVAYIGDDLQDLPVLRRCGLAFAPADAAVEVRQEVHRVLVANGGEGAVREMVELLLKGRGDWDRLVKDEVSEGGRSSG